MDTQFTKSASENKIEKNYYSNKLFIFRRASIMTRKQGYIQKLKSLEKQKTTFHEFDLPSSKKRSN